MSDFEKVTAFMLENFSHGQPYEETPLDYISDLQDEVYYPQIPTAKRNEAVKIYEAWSPRTEAAFLIYFGNECMNRIKERQ